MAKAHPVKFKAKKRVSVPVEVKFKATGGQNVDFDAHKAVKRMVTVKFLARNK